MSVNYKYTGFMIDKDSIFAGILSDKTMDEKLILNKTPFLNIK